MDKKFMRMLCERAAEGKEGDPIRFVASSEGIKRDGFNIETAGWQLDNYRKNPVVLWVHDYWGRNLPIGKATVAAEDNSLVADIIFDIQDDFAAQIDRKYRNGFLNAVSVGWDTIAFKPAKDGKPPTITEAELLDISAVPVPGDPDALMEREWRALNEIYGERNQRKLSDPINVDVCAASEADVWNGVSSAMLALFRNHAAMEEEKRKNLYILLERSYRKLGKTAPEYRTQAELLPLSEEEIDGLFLEGEAGASLSIQVPGAIDQVIGNRAGAVLNARNAGDLEQAVTLIQGVLERAKKEEEDEDRVSEGEMFLPALENIRSKLNTIGG
jgi:HK97 family phage prohead protease